MQDRAALCSETVFFCVPLAPGGMLGLALASRQKCLHSCFVPWPPTIQEPSEDTAGRTCGVGFSEDGGVTESLSLIPEVTVFLS